MPVDITIPSPGESITEVTLGTWHKNSGDWVTKDDPLVEIESDKVTLEVSAPETGLLNVIAKSGAEMKVGSVIGSVDPSATKPAGASINGSTVASSASNTGAAASAAARPTPSAPPPADHPARSATAVESATEEAARTAVPSHATSVARKMAAEKGIDLSKLQGTGPSGRVRKQDVLALQQAGGTHPGGANAGGANAGGANAGGTGILPVPSPSNTARMAVPPSHSQLSIHGERSRGIRREKMTKLRQRIAERLVQAQHTAAMLTTFNEVDCGEMMRLRSLHKDDFEKRHNVGLGFMSFFVKAATSALQKFPRVNAYVAGAEIEYHDFCDVSVAVGTEKGLVVPIIRDAHLMSFAEVEATIKDFAVRAKAGKLTIDEMTGGTFTISNGGTYGSLNSTPILNPPQSGILGMHTIKKRAVEYPKDSGQIALRPMMYVALSYDHRIVDGAEAVGFLVHIKNAIENPERMLLGL